VIDVLEDRIELLLTDGQIIQLSRTQIVDVRSLDASGDAKSFYEDSAANRLVVMPTGFPLERGEFHIASQELVAVTGSYGITEWLSVWAGVSIPGALFSLRASVLAGERVGVSVGSFVGASWFDLSLGPLVLPYALVSVGEPNNNVTAGAGFGMAFSDGFSVPGAVLAIGGKRTLTATTAIVTENWIAWLERDDSWMDPDLSPWTAVPSMIAPSVVFRIASDRLSWDLGAVVPFFIERTWDAGLVYALTTPVIPVPLFSVTYRIR
jgi:hypothetical protein